jgi:Helix-turn-helix domain
VNADSKKTQQARILALLLRARGGWVPLSQILDLQISQFGSRILELRRSGFAIENEQEIVGGHRHSRYRLLPGADRAERKSPQQLTVATAGTFPQFGDIAPGSRGYPD